MIMFSCMILRIIHITSCTSMEARTSAHLCKELHDQCHKCTCVFKYSCIGPFHKWGTTKGLAQRCYIWCSERTFESQKKPKTERFCRSDENIDWCLCRNLHFTICSQSKLKWNEQWMHISHYGLIRGMVCFSGINREVRRINGHLMSCSSFFFLVTVFVSFFCLSIISYRL